MDSVQLPSQYTKKSPQHPGAYSPAPYRKDLASNSRVPIASSVPITATVFAAGNIIATTLGAAAGAFSRDLDRIEPTMAYLKNPGLLVARVPHIAVPNAHELAYALVSPGVPLLSPSQPLYSTPYIPQHVVSSKYVILSAASSGSYPLAQLSGAVVPGLPYLQSQRPSIPSSLRQLSAVYSSDGVAASLDSFAPPVDMSGRFSLTAVPIVHPGMQPLQVSNMEMQQQFQPMVALSHGAGASFTRHVAPFSPDYKDFDLSPHSAKPRPSVVTSPNGAQVTERPRSDSSSKQTASHNKGFNFVMVNDPNMLEHSNPKPTGQTSPEVSHKWLCHKLADDMERHLNLLVRLAAGCTYANLAERVKNLDAKDPVFGSVCNLKDIRLNKHHQLFALMWLSRQCKTSYSTVVTRTRVYTHYVDICNKQDLPPLMSCRFGKLVRILFPNLTTRRLGVRGKSRYFYCGLKLIGHLDKSASPVSPSTKIASHSPLLVRTNTAGELDAIESIAGAPRLNLSRFNEHFNVIELRYIPGLFTKIENSVNSENKSAPLEFPCVLSYVPEDMDVDYAMAESLQKAYKAHLNSVFDLIRYIQPEKLFELCSALLADVGPACKLMVDERLARWVKDCDLIMFRAVMKMLSRLYLQNLPVMIVDPLKTLAKELHLRIKDLMAKQFPALFVDLKMREVGQFVDLLKRLLSCIESSNHISTILSNTNHKVVMLNDWLLLDISDIIMRELPCGSANVDKLVELLETRLVKLLGDPTSSRPVMAKYSEFLFQLPGEFPDANPWLFLLLASNVLTTCIREMTLQGSRSFKSWWILRCWVDEFIKWSLELGGYLHDDFEQQIQPVVKTETFEEPQSFDHQFSLERHNDNNYYVDLLELPENGSLNWV